MVRSVPSPTPVPDARARSGFITLLGAMSLVLAALGLFSGLVQLVAIGLAPGELLTQWLSELATGLAALPELPAVLAWCLAHVVALSVAGTAMSGLLLAVSWGLLLRQEWARVAFIALLLLGTLLNLAGLLLVWQVQQWILAVNAGLGDPGLEARMHGFGIAIFAMTGVCTLLLVGIHLWLVQRLRTPAVRAEFTPAS